jgi:5-methyltetrahydropteroyltriglutamate--homocysteine methyltransferase
MAQLGSLPLYPRPQRGQWLTEADWGGKISQEELLAEAKRLRLAHWTIQKEAGVDSIPSNDFALYDQVLHHIQDFGVCNTLY